MARSKQVLTGLRPNLEQLERPREPAPARQISGLDLFPACGLFRPGAVGKIKSPFFPGPLVLLVRPFRCRYPVQIGGAQHALLSHRPAELNIGMGARPTRQLIPALQAVGQGPFRQGLAPMPQDRVIGLDAAFHRVTPDYSLINT